MLYSSQRKATVHKATKVHTHHFTNTGVTQVTATMLENTDIPKKHNASGTPKEQYRATSRKCNTHPKQCTLSTCLRSGPAHLSTRFPEAHKVPSELTVSHKHPQPNKKIPCVRHTQRAVPNTFHEKCNTHPKQVLNETTPLQRKVLNTTPKGAMRQSTCLSSGPAH